MNAWTLKTIRAIVCLLVATLLIGCNKSDDTTTAQSRSASAIVGPNESSQGQTDSGSPDAAQQDTGMPADTQPESSDANAPRQGTALTIEPPKIEPKGRQLAADLTPEKLIEFLAGADKDVHLIASGRAGITDPRQARDEMQRITKLKLEGSRRLKDHADADDELKSEGARGELQALSALASLGDVKSANELERLAAENLKSGDAQLVSESRLVLIGFELESLQNGKAEAADRIIELIEDLANSDTPPDMPAMMVMGQSRQVLSQSGYEDKSQIVRNKIIELFADSSDPTVAKMAAQLAGNVRFDDIDKLRADIVDGQTVSADKWQEAATKLINESADLMTVQYLAGAALEFEAVGQEELADATYDVMGDRFNQPDEATTREVEIAIQAREARLDVLGKEFDPELPSTGGTTLSMKDYLGKVVLMPFWATGFPESLQVVPLLTNLRDENPDKIAIVGMNLDPAGSKVDAYADKELGFPSFRSESSEAATMGNPVAARFGVVSMPFVAIINQKGQIEAIDFSGRKLGPTIKRLLDE